MTQLPLPPPFSPVPSGVITLYISPAVLFQMLQEPGENNGKIAISVWQIDPDTKDVNPGEPQYIDATAQLNLQGTIELDLDLHTLS